jgi:uncharacterized protein (TIGR00730 family)
MLKNVCVFCGSRPGARAEYTEAALARNAGGHVIGVIPQALVRKEVAHYELEDLRIVSSMHERKAQMADLADAFIALPGGFGTFEEFFEVVTWAQIGLHRKPCALLNVAGYYDPLIALIEHAVTEGFAPAIHRRNIVTDTDAERLLDTLAEYVGVRVWSSSIG